MSPGMQVGDSPAKSAIVCGVAQELPKGLSTRSVWTTDTSEGANAEGVLHRWAKRSRSFRSDMDVKLRKRDPESKWGCFRKLCRIVLEAKVQTGDTMSIFDMCMSAAICYNVFTIVMATNAKATCDPGDSTSCEPEWIAISTKVLVALYTFELALRINVLRMRFPLSMLNNLDFVIVGFGYLDLLILDYSQSVKKFSVLRLLRIIRIARFTRVLRTFPMLRSMMAGFMAAMQAMSWGVLLIFLMLLVWSIIVVELINPVNKTLDNTNTWCDVAFTSVGAAVVLFFQTIMASDAWGQCTIPVILAAPWTSLIFAGALLTVQLGFMNLILAIIVDKAAESKEAETMEQSAKTLRNWRQLAQGLDTDNSGTLSLEELMGAFDEPEMRLIFQNMALAREDVSMLFQLMDFNGTGQVSYHEVVDTLHKAQVQDGRAYMMMIRLAVHNLGHSLSRHVDTRLNGMSDTIRELSARLQRCSPQAAGHGGWKGKFAGPPPGDYGAPAPAGGADGPRPRTPGLEQEPYRQAGAGNRWQARRRSGGAAGEESASLAELTRASSGCSSTSMDASPTHCSPGVPC